MDERPSRDEADEALEAITEAAEAAGMRVADPEEFAAFLAEGERLTEEHRARSREEGRRFLDEETDRELIETWFREARECASVGAAADLARRLLADYHHDYGTIVHAVAAGAVAMANGMNREGHQGGLTGFQAGFVFWGFYKHWMREPDGPKRLVSYEDMLYPQSERTFRAITPDTWAWLQARARERLAESPDAHPKVAAHWRSIVDGTVPFGFAVEDA
jgi:hypothetical protein